jgi:prepilin-type N-terminal cleavage/methylation domain-containing protein
MDHKRGFTLIELLVAVSIFVAVIMIITSALVYAIRMQRQNLAYQQLLDQTSFVMEYMSRHIRMAKKQTPDVTLACIGADENYQSVGNNIKFLRYKQEPGTDPLLVCSEFFLDSGELQEEVYDGVSTSTHSLTSPSLTVNDFSVNVTNTGEDEQPLVGIYLAIGGREDTEIKIKTSVSQRDLNY